MKPPKFPVSQARVCLGEPCSKCELPIDGIGYETLGSDGREPVVLLYCPTCLERVRQVASMFDSPPST